MILLRNLIKHVENGKTRNQNYSHELLGFTLVYGILMIVAFSLLVKLFVEVYCVL